MAFPVFASGDILNASDMNAVGLWKIGGASFTTVAGFILPAGSFDADYTNYRLIVRFSAVATDTTITGRLRASGVDASGSDYGWGWYGNTTASATPVGTNSGTGTSWSLGESDNNGVYSQAYTLDIDIYGPALAAVTTFAGRNMFVNTGATSTALRSGNGIHNLQTAYDSFNVISTQNVTGTYWLYGYRD